MDALEELKKRRNEEERQKNDEAAAIQAEEENRLDPARISAEIEALIEKLQSLAALDNPSYGEQNDMSKLSETLAGGDEAIYLGSTISSSENRELVHAAAQAKNHEETILYLKTANSGAQYHPSLKRILERGKLTDPAWETIVQKGSIERLLPDDYMLWVPVLNNDPDLADRLIQAAEAAEEKRRAIWEQAEKARKTRNWIIGLAVASVLVFLISRCFTG